MFDCREIFQGLIDGSSVVLLQITRPGIFNHQAYDHPLWGPKHSSQTHNKILTMVFLIRLKAANMSNKRAEKGLPSGSYF